MPDPVSASPRPSLVFFTDLDGTLLDHDTYSHEPAQEALTALRNADIPLILASSKTAAEIAPLRKEIGFSQCPAIVENGAGILEGEGNTEINGSGLEDTYTQLLEKLALVPAQLRDHFIGFSQWDAAKVSEMTGLAPAAAVMAKTRQFSEPGLWSGSDEELALFRDALTEQGIIAQKGGRFLTLSFGGNKVDRMGEIAARYCASPEERFVIALGDAPNDLAMLENADLGIIIPNPSHPGIAKLLSKPDSNIIHAPFSGPQGWNAAVLDVLLKEG